MTIGDLIATVLILSICYGFAGFSIYVGHYDAGCYVSGKKWTPRRQNRVLWGSVFWPIWGIIGTIKWLVKSLWTAFGPETKEEK